MNVKKTAAAALALSAALMASPALADGFAVYENSARGVGMAGAMMFSDEASLVAYNPAGLWRLKDNGRGQISGAVTYIAPRGKANFYHDDGSFDHSEHNKNNPAYVPTLFWAKKLSDRWAIGEARLQDLACARRMSPAGTAATAAATPSTQPCPSRRPCRTGWRRTCIWG